MQLNKKWTFVYKDNFLPLQNFIFEDKDFFDISFNNFNVNFKKEEFNSFGYRSDEFIKEHFHEHILFVGCSITYGVGLEKEKTWPDILYKKISKEKKLSGYFNLSVPGSSIFDQVFRIFKYFKEFGHPKHLFLNIPEAMRFYLNEDKIIYNAIYDNYEYNLLSLLGYQYYLMLDSYCKTNKINLYCFSNTNQETKLSFDEILSTNFDTYYANNQDKKWQYIFNYHINKKEDKNWDKAKDEKHPGTGYHLYWANFIYKKYKERNYL